MTLKEKLCEPFGGLKTETVNELEQITDDFAIGFAEWTFINFPNQYKVHQYKEKDGFYTTKKLLEIYKKEII